MSFPDLERVLDVTKAPYTVYLPNVAEATGVPVAGDNTFAIPFLELGLDPVLIDPSRMKIFFDPDPDRPAGGSLDPGVTDVRFVSLSADKQFMTLSFAQSAAGTCRLVVEVNHTTPGVGAIDTPVIIGSGSGSSGGGGGSFTCSLTKLFADPLEIGADLISPDFDATYTPLGTETSATLEDTDGNGPTSVLAVPNPITWPFAFQQSGIGDTVTFTLLASDGVNNASDTQQALWLPRVYYGVDADPALATEADIEGLSNSALQADAGLSFLFTALNQYVYYAFPVAFVVVPTDFQIGPFPGGMIQTVASVNVTANTPGAPVFAYQIWRSTNLLNTTVTGPQTLQVTA